MDNGTIRSALLNYRLKRARKLCDQCFDMIADAERRSANAHDLAHQKHAEGVRDVKNEHDAENARLKEDLMFAVAFLHSDKELERYREFILEHEACRLRSKADGGKMPYVVQYSTGIGVCTTVVCQACGATADITDTSIW